MYQQVLKVLARKAELEEAVIGGGGWRGFVLLLLVGRTNEDTVLSVVSFHKSILYQGVMVI